jgi:Uma2 family endonuclease
MSVPHAIERYTPQEYYALEREAAYKSDYYDGEIFAMSGGSSRHSLIAVNIAGELRQRLKGKPCAPYEANQRLKVLATGLRTYPDVSVFCGKMEYDAEDAQKETATNPTVLFEILSPSTEAYDRGLKAEHYRRIESLRTHVLVSQDAPHVEVFERQGDGSWRFSEVRGREAVVALPSIHVTLPLTEIYDRVEFDDEGARLNEAPPKSGADAPG